MVAACDNELARLIGAMCDGTITAEETAQLDKQLSQDAAARQYYNNYLFLHGELYSHHAATISDQQLAAVSRELEDASQTASRRNWRGWLAIAATIFGVAASSSWLTYSLTGPWRQPTEVASAAKENSNRVARITATRNCLWAEPGPEVGFGSRLASGQQLNLATGFVEVTFDDGAVVVLEGPATFDVQSPGKAQLREGRLSAVVPQRAQGFEVATSRLSVVDRGAEFGLMADAAGATEIHVFNGLVKAQLLDDSGHQVRTVELNAAEAARIEPAAALVARIPTRDDEFVRTLSVTSGPHDGLYAYDGFNYPAGPLAEQNGGFGWAGPWSIVETEGKSDPNSNGVQPGNLEFEGLVPLGNRASQTAQQTRIRRSLSTSVGGVFDSAGLVENQDGVRLIGRDGMTLYLSFLQHVDKTNDVFYGFELHRGDGNANRVLCVGNGVNDTGYGVTSNFNVYGKRNFPSLGKENTETNFFVLRFTFGHGNRDRVEVFRNPKSLTDVNVCILNAELVGNFAFDRISLGNFHGTKIHEVDEVRVGTTFLAVTGRRGRNPDRLTPDLTAGVLEPTDLPWSRSGREALGSRTLAMIGRRGLLEN